MPELIGAAAVELARFFSPLTVALENEGELTLFLRRFGIAFSINSLTGAVTTLAPLRDGARAIATAAEDAATSGLQPADIKALFEAARALFTSLDNISPTLSGLTVDGMTPEALAQVIAALPEEIFDLLLADYLRTRVPIALWLLLLLDVYRPQTIPATERGIRYVRHTFDWSRVG